MSEYTEYTVEIRPYGGGQMVEVWRKHISIHFEWCHTIRAAKRAAAKAIKADVADNHSSSIKYTVVA